MCNLLAKGECKMKAIDITDMSNRQIEELVQTALVELQDRRYRIYDDAITHGLYVGEIEEKYRDGYIDYLAECAGPGESPAALEILHEWHAQEEIKQSRKTTGA